MEPFDPRARDALEDRLRSSSADSSVHTDEKSGACECLHDTINEDAKEPCKFAVSNLKESRSRNTSPVLNCDIFNDLAKEADKLHLECEEENIALVEEDEIDEDTKYELSHDIFSMWFLAPSFSSSSLYAFVVFIVQIVILSLVLFNKLHDPRDKGNAFNVPVRNSISEDISQFFALLISVFVSVDVVDSLEAFLIKYDKNILRDFPHAYKTKWILSNVARFIEGLLGLLVAWVFIIQSTDVLDLFLNFTAVQFVSEMDNVGYYIASKGYIVSGEMQTFTNSITQVRMHQHGTRDDGGEVIRKTLRTRKLLQRIVFYGTLSILLSSWGALKILQTRGLFYKYGCQRFQIHLPSKEYAFFQKCRATNEKCPTAWETRVNSTIQYSHFSGFYKLRTNKLGGAELSHNGFNTGRPVYEQVSPMGDYYPKNPESPPGIFKYCEEESAWIFTIDGVTKGAHANDCSWLLKSPKTLSAATLDDVPEAGWEIWTGAIEEGALSITCLDCTDTEGMRSADQITDSGCNFHGECGEKEGMCHCLPRFGGTRCSRCLGCDIFDVFSKPGSEFIGTFKRLDRSLNEPVEVYDRMVRYNVTKESSGIWVPSRPLHAFFFWIDRYVVWNIDNDIKMGHLGESSGDVEDLMAFFDTFHAAWIESKPWYVAEKNLDRWENADPKWKLFEDYIENPEYTFNSYSKFQYKCRGEEDLTCPFKIGFAE